MSAASHQDGYRLVRTLGLALLVVYVLCLVSIQSRTCMLGLHAERSDPEFGNAVGIVFYDDSSANRHARVAKGVERLLAGHVSELIMVGGSRTASGYLGSREMVEEAIVLGANDTQLRHDLRSNDTWSNLESALRMIPSVEKTRIELISDPLHLARIDLVLWRLGFRGSANLIPSSLNETVVGYWRRLNHELLGYVFLIIPRSVATEILEYLRARTDSLPAPDRVSLHSTPS